MCRSQGSGSPIEQLAGLPQPTQARFALPPVNDDSDGRDDDRQTKTRPNQPRHNVLGSAVCRRALQQGEGQGMKQHQRHSHKRCWAHTVQHATRDVY
jgi:hypothetical protein